MKKIISFIFAILLFTQLVHAESSVVTEVTGNLIPAYETTEPEPPEDELYYYKLIITSSNGTSLLEMNIYNFVNMAELFNENTINFLCNESIKPVFKLYKGDVFQRSLSVSSLTDGTLRSMIVANKKLSFSAVHNNENICTSVKIQAASDDPVDCIDAYFRSAENWLYVGGGSFPIKGRPATIIISKAGDPSDIKHIQQTFIDYNGDFNADFKFDGNIKDCVLKIAVEDYLYAIDVAIDDTLKEQNANLSGIYHNGGISVIMNANKAFVGNNKTSKLVLAFYERDGRLISAQVGNNFDMMLEENQIPENAAKTKIFALDLINGIKPQAQPIEISF